MTRTRIVYKAIIRGCAIMVMRLLPGVLILQKEQLHVGIDRVNNWLLREPYLQTCSLCLTTSLYNIY